MRQLNSPAPDFNSRAIKDEVALKAPTSAPPSIDPNRSASPWIAHCLLARPPTRLPRGTRSASRPPTRRSRTPSPSATSRGPNAAPELDPPALAPYSNRFVVQDLPIRRRPVGTARRSGAATPSTATSPGFSRDVADTVLHEQQRDVPRAMQWLAAADKVADAASEESASTKLSPPLPKGE